MPNLGQYLFIEFSWAIGTPTSSHYCLWLLSHNKKSWVVVMETAWPTCLKYLQSGLFKGNFVNHWTVNLNSCSYVMDCNRKFLIARIYILFQVTICFAPCQSNLAWVPKWCFSNCLEGTVGFISSPLQMFMLCKMLPITKKRKNT